MVKEEGWDKKIFKCTDQEEIVTDLIVETKPRLELKSTVYDPSSAETNE